MCVVLRDVDWARRCAILDLAADESLDLELCLSPTIFAADLYATWRRQDRALVRDIELEGLPPVAVTIKPAS